MIAQLHANIDMVSKKEWKVIQTCSASDWKLHAAADNHNAPINLPTCDFFGTAATHMQFVVIGSHGFIKEIYCVTAALPNFQMIFILDSSSKLPQPAPAMAAPCFCHCLSHGQPHGGCISPCFQVWTVESNLCRCWTMPLHQWHLHVTSTVCSDVQHTTLGWPCNSQFMLFHATQPCDSPACCCLLPAHCGLWGTPWFHNFPECFVLSSHNQHCCSPLCARLQSHRGLCWPQQFEAVPMTTTFYQNKLFSQVSLVLANLQVDPKELLDHSQPPFINISFFSATKDSCWDPHHVLVLSWDWSLAFGIGVVIVKMSCVVVFMCCNAWKCTAVDGWHHDWHHHTPGAAWSGKQLGRPVIAFQASQQFQETTTESSRFSRACTALKATGLLSCL